MPQGGRLPFELVVLGPDSIEDFDLVVEAEADNEALHQDFEFLEVNPQAGADDYCLLGRLRNLGGQINAYLLVVAVLYDDQDRVINYSDDFQRFPDGLVGDTTTDFDVCVNPLKQNVARYELRAWGS